jgi:hypothetical protein
MTHTELCGEASLVVITTEVGASSNKVVRWCPNCGAVVVDEDHNGRVIFGAYKEMQFPKMAGKALALGLLTGMVRVEELPERDRIRIIEDLERRRKNEGKIA